MLSRSLRLHWLATVCLVVAGGGWRRSLLSQVRDARLRHGMRPSGLGLGERDARGRPHKYVLTQLQSRLITTQLVSPKSVHQKYSPADVVAVNPASCTREIPDRRKPCRRPRPTATASRILRRTPTLQNRNAAAARARRGQEENKAPTAALPLRRTTGKHGADMMAAR